MLIMNNTLQIKVDIEEIIAHCRFLVKFCRKSHESYKYDILPFKRHQAGTIGVALTFVTGSYRVTHRNSRSVVLFASQTLLF